MWSNVDFSVGMGRIHGNASVFSLSMQQSRFLWWDGTIRLIVSVIRVQIEAWLCWDGARFSLLFFDMTTVQSCLFRGNNAEFSVGMGNGAVLSFSMQESRFLWWDGTIRLIVSVIRVQIEA